MTESKTPKEGTANSGGWKTCSRGHKYRGPGPCPVCWPGRKRAGAVKGGESKSAEKSGR
jgi:hypothetical protein